MYLEVVREEKKEKYSIWSKSKFTVCIELLFLSVQVTKIYYQSYIPVLFFLLFSRCVLCQKDF